MTIGIYCIENIKDNKKYIGKAINIEKRWMKHKTYLKANTHINKHLQQAWNKHGREVFNFYIIEECEREKLSEKEIFYISYFNCMKDGYNFTSGGDGVLNFKVSDETKKKLSDINTGKKHSQETKDKISKAKKNPSLETREKWSKFRKGKVPWNKGKTGVYTEEKRKEMGKSNIGRHPTEETKKKISESMKILRAKRKGNWEGGKI
jgi:group I intron endonuclease